MKGSPEEWNMVLFTLLEKYHEQLKKHDPDAIIKCTEREAKDLMNNGKLYIATAETGTPFGETVFRVAERKPKSAPQRNRAIDLSDQ